MLYKRRPPHKRLFGAPRRRRGPGPRRLSPDRKAIGPRYTLQYRVLCDNRPVTPFDLVFLVSFVGVLVAGTRIAWRLARGRTGDAKRSAMRLTAFLGLYGIVLVAFSLATPQQRMAIGETQCFDDWCIAVVSVARQPEIGNVSAKGVFWIVATKVSSRARNRQRETGAFAYLTDRRGRRFDASTEGQVALERAGIAGSPLTAFVEPGGVFESRLAFDVPRDATDLAFVKASGWFPVAFIIGDPGSFLHRRTVVTLPAPR